jgi:hypothetical protein
MNPSRIQKPKTDYNLILVNVRGDRDFMYELKSRAANAKMKLADYVRSQLDPSFVATNGNEQTQNGKE